MDDQPFQDPTPDHSQDASDLFYKFLYGPQSDSASKTPPIEPVEIDDNPPSVEDGKPFEVRGNPFPLDPTQTNPEMDDLRQQIQDLQDEIKTIEATAYKPSPYANPFVFKCVATSGTAISWQEQC